MAKEKIHTHPKMEKELSVPDDHCIVDRELIEKLLKENMFGGENSEQFNALMQALKNCAGSDNISIYGWLAKIPKTSMVVKLVDKLHELGFKIIKKGGDKNHTKTVEN